MMTNSDIKKNTRKINGRWSSAEHQRFLKGLDIFGRNWVQVQRVVKTRSLVQVRSHAQKVFMKMGQDEIYGQSDSQFIYDENSNSQNCDSISDVALSEVAQFFPPKQNLLQCLSRALHKEETSDEKKREKEFSQKKDAEAKKFKLPPQKKIEKQVEKGLCGSLFLSVLTANRTHFENGGTFFDLIIKK